MFEPAGIGRRSSRDAKGSIVRRGVERREVEGGEEMEGCAGEMVLRGWVGKRVDLGVEEWINRHTGMEE